MGKDRGFFFLVFFFFRMSAADNSKNQNVRGRSRARFGGSSSVETTSGPPEKRAKRTIQFQELVGK